MDKCNLNEKLGLISEFEEMKVIRSERLMSCN